MQSPLPLWTLSATELKAGYLNKSFSPIDVLESCWERLEQINPLLNALVFLDKENALQSAHDSAARWAKGEPLSSIDGIPVSVKDNIHVANLPTTWGSQLYKDAVPSIDELPVEKLRAAGAILFGKTNVPEFTLQGYTDNLVFGTTYNPWDRSLTPGGSSGGAAAAVASGIGPIALATDGGGSIRRPSSHTGLVGLKPSLGRVPRANGLPVILHECEVIGPMCRTVDDIELAMQIISIADNRDPLSLPFAQKPYTPIATAKPCRILHIGTFKGAPVDPQVAQSVAQAAKDLGKLGHQVEFCPSFDLVNPINELVWPIIGQTGLAWLLRTHPEWQGRISPALVEMAEAGAELSSMDYLEALDTIKQVKRDLAELFQHYDLLLTPTAAALPWSATEVFPDTINNKTVGPRGHAIFTAFCNAAGLPAISVPCSPSEEGLPIGFQLVGSHGDDELLCAVTRGFEKKHPWAHRWPMVMQA